MENNKSKFHVYLCFGQSNMEGAKPLVPGTTNQYQEIPEKYKNLENDRFRVMAAVNMNTTTPKRSMGKWYPAVPPLVRDWTGLTPADFFGRTLVEGISDPEIKIGVIVVAVGGACINLFEKDREEVAAYIEKDTARETYMKDLAAAYDNYPYGRLVELAKQAQDDGGVIKGILLHQGESGRGKAPEYEHGSDNENWTKAVKGIYDDLLADLGLEPNSIPLLAGQAVDNKIEIINDLPKAMPGVAHIISSKDLPQGDDWHFNFDGYEGLGKRYGEKMLELNC
jgi:hypothetical protein